MRKEAKASAGAVAAITFSILFLCWPSILNGGAFFFPDTSAYLRGADAALAEVAGWRSEWSDKYRFYQEQNQGSNAEVSGREQKEPKAANAAAEPIHPPLLGRSIYYGLAILPFITLIGSIGGALLQATCAVFAIWFVLGAFGVDRQKIPIFLLFLSAILAGVTSLPYFVSLLMPDVFAGITILLAIAASFGWSHLRFWERVGLTLLLIFCVLTHSSHLLILLLLLGAISLARLFIRTVELSGIAVLLLAAVCGITAERVFISVVNERLGEPPIRPPFLTARLIAAGPGQAFLEDRCSQVDFEVCRFVDRGPRDSDTFLWSLNPEEGVFAAESHAVQRRLANQDLRFALATLRYQPLQIMQTSAEAAVQQIFMTELDIFNAPQAASAGFATNLPRSQAEEVRASRYGSQSMPVQFAQTASAFTTLAAAIFLAALGIGWLGTRARKRQQIRLAATLFLFAIAANAAVTGTLSKPHDRYNARLVWVLPLAALVFVRKIYALESETNHAKV